MDQLKELPIPLLLWYRENARVLPWRSHPTPYRVWVSEIMLQQTRVAAVLGYFARFMAAFPTIQDLADAPEDVLMKQWQGLGYYSRARNLQKAARQIMDEHGGVFPTDYPAIRALAGIGDYTAAAIASICFGQPVPAVDGNLLRVAARVLADDTDITTTQGERDRLAEMIGNQSDLKVLSIKDYIKNPKESGYKSYHMLVSVPIFLSDSVVDTKVEIQIRTIAMDFWASLEHKIYYKFEGDAPDYISRDLRECAEMVSTLDEKMLSLNEAIQECLEKQEELNMSTKTKESNREDQRVLQGLD